jgi:O-antigen ligase
MHFALGPTQEMRNTRIFNGHPHNFPLLILSEWGLPGAIALGFFIFILLRNFSKNLPKDNPDLIVPSYYISLIAGLLYSLVSGVTVMPLSQIMGAIIVANCLVIYFQNKLVLSSTKKMPYQIVIGALLLFSLLMISINVIPNLRDLPRAESLWFQEHQADIGEFIPRFWLQGWLTDGTKKLPK